MTYTVLVPIVTEGVILTPATLAIICRVCYTSTGSFATFLGPAVTLGISVATDFRLHANSAANKGQLQTQRKRRKIHRSYLFQKKETYDYASETPWIYEENLSTKNI